MERIPAGAPLASADAHPAATGVPVLDVQNLRVWFSLPQGTLRAVDGVTFRLFRGRSLGLIGESGSGKSMTAWALLRLIPPPGWIASGLIQLCVNGVPIELTGLDALGEPMRTVRGGAIGMVFQDPASSLSPVRTLGGQMVEAIRAHRRLDRARGREAALDMLHRVGLRDPRRCFEAYPHQLSGGMCQRAVMALALCCRPAVLVADEPTSALDLTLQAQILQLMADLQGELQMAVLHITHDLGAVAATCNEVAVMYLGRIVEYGPLSAVFANPLHPYTVKLLKASRRLGRGARRRLETIPGGPAAGGAPAGCGFYGRCDQAMPQRCDAAVPGLAEIEPAHWVRCYLHSPAEEPHG